MTTYSALSIANLQTTGGPPLADDIAFVGGYYAVGDGGGGNFYFKSAPASAQITNAVGTTAAVTGATNPGALTVVGAAHSVAVPISGATNASPIVIATTSAHGYVTGQTVFVGGVGGNTAANGTWEIVLVDTTHFSLINSTGNGAYTSGGSCSAARWTVTGASDTATIVIDTLSAHGLSTGQSVTISGILGNTYANGTWPITVVSSTSFSLSGPTNHAPYVSGGFAVPNIALTTSAAHGLATGQSVIVSGVAGNTAANGRWRIRVIDSTHFALDGTIQTGIYTSGGTAKTMIVLTVAGHPFSTGQRVAVSGVVGNTAANNLWTVTKLDTDHIQLDNSVANGNYASGGNASSIVITTNSAHGLLDTQRVMIAGVAGNTAANGTWRASKIDATTFSIPAAANGAYTSGGCIGDGGLTIPSASVLGRWHRILG